MTLVSPLASNPEFRAEVESLGVRLEEFPLVVKGRVEPFTEEFVKCCYFRHKRTHVARYYLNRAESEGLPPRARLYKRLMIDGSALAAPLIPLRALAAFEKRLWLALHGLERERRLLERIQPDLVVSTMPLSHRLERPLLWAAADLGLRRACVVQSWDNLTTKGMFPVEFEMYLVWSEHMKAAALSEYPELPPERVVPCGAPQFDFYRDPRLILSREEFRGRIGADPARPLIVWTGVSPGLMPGEPRALALLCEALRAGRVRANPQLLLRPHPIGGGARFAAVREQYPEMLFTETNDEDPATLIRWSPTREDMVLQASTIAHADVNINMFSTMTIDSCIFDRPVVNTAFDEPAPGASSARLRRFYDFEYYRVVLEAGAARLATTLDEMVEHLNAYLENPALDREGRARLVETQCGRVDGESARRTAAIILEAAARHANPSRLEAAVVGG